MSDDSRRERWRRVEELFHAGVGLPASERKALVGRDVLVPSRNSPLPVNVEPRPVGSKRAKARRSGLRKFF